MRPRKGDNDAGHRVARLAGQCESVLTTAELRACGLSPSEISTRRRQGSLHLLYRGVYAVGHANLSPLGQCVAAVKACGKNSLLSRSSVLAVEGIVPWSEALPPDVTLVGTSVPKRRGIRIHRTSAMPAQDVRRLGCIRTTSVARAIADLAADVADDELIEIVRRAQGKRRVTHVQLVSVHRRLGRRPGSGRLARAIALGPAPTRSVLEDVVLDLILRGGLARPDVNVPLVIDGRRIVPDFRWPAQRLVIEADGAVWHSGPAAERSDADRQALLEAHGERVERVTWQQAVTEEAHTLSRFRRAGAPDAA